MNSRSLVLSALLATTCMLNNAIAETTPPTAPTQKAAATEKDKDVVAEVNGKAILRRDIDSRLQRQYAKQLRSFSEEQIHHLRKRLLDTMISRELLLQEAANSGFEPAPSEVESFIGSLKAKIGSDEAFKAFLQENNVSETEFTAGVRSDISLKKYLENKVFLSVSPTEAELRKAFEKAPAEYQMPVEVKARHILFAVPASAKDDEIAKTRKRAEGVLAQAEKNPEKFAELAKKYSEGPSKVKGGELGYFTKNQMVKPFADAAFSMEPGAVSDIVRTDFGFHIIKVEDRRGGGEPDFEAAKPMIRNQLVQSRRKSVMEGHLKRLRESNKVILYIK